MALSEDQKAMLRLLAQRGAQGYEDLGALLGIGADEVHAKAQEAAAQLEAEGIPAPVIPPPPEETPPRKPSGEPQPPPEPSPAPEPAKPEPAPEPTLAKPASAPKPAAASRSGFELPSGKGARAGIAASALVVIAFVLILLLSGGSDSDDPGSDASGRSPASNETAGEAAQATPDLTQAVLRPVGGGDAEGRAIFGRVKKEVILQVQAEGLEPSPEGSSYTVWLYKSPKLALRIGSVNVTESGGIAAQFPLPTELLAYVAGGAFDQIDISLTEKAAYQAEIAKAKGEERLPAYTGEDVLRGPITGPAIKAARAAERE